MFDLTALAEWLAPIEDTAIAIMIRESGTAFPWLESVHVMAVALVFGVISIVDLRLMGLAGHGYRTGRLLSTLLPLTWIAFVVAVITGLAMFTAQPGRYLATPAFQYKMILLILAGLNMAVFHVWTQRNIAIWEESGPIPIGARAAGLLSLVLWLGVVFAGRFIGFTLAF